MYSSTEDDLDPVPTAGNVDGELLVVYLKGVKVNLVRCDDVRRKIDNQLTDKDITATEENNVVGTDGGDDIRRKIDDQPTDKDIISTQENHVVMKDGGDEKRRKINDQPTDKDITATEENNVVGIDGGDDIRRKIDDQPTDKDITTTQENDVVGTDGGEKVDNIVVEVRRRQEKLAKEQKHVGRRGTCPECGKEQA